jgi:hypothetical protein
MSPTLITYVSDTSLAVILIGAVDDAMLMRADAHSFASP